MLRKVEYPHSQEVLRRIRVNYISGSDRNIGKFLVTLSLSDTCLTIECVAGLVESRDTPLSCPQRCAFVWKWVRSCSPSNRALLYALIDPGLRAIPVRRRCSGKSRLVACRRNVPAVDEPLADTRNGGRILTIHHLILHAFVGTHTSNKVR